MLRFFLNIKQWVITGGILFCVFNLIAQKLPPYFQHYDVTSGLSSNSITCLLKDSKGYLWIGTNDGLNKFNGTIFEVFRNDAHNENSIPENYIRTIYEDSKHRIWISSGDGWISCYKHPKRLKKEFENYDLSGNFLNIGGVGLSLYFFENNKGDLFAYTGRGLLFLLNEKTGKFEKFINQGIEGNLLEVDKSNNEFIFLKDNDSLYKCNTQTAEICHYTSTALEKFLRKNNTARKFFYRTSNHQNFLWLLTEQGLLVRFNTSVNQLDRNIQLPAGYITKTTRIRTIGENLQGQICFGLGNGGLLVYDKQLDRFEKIEIPFELPNENRLAEIYSFFLDGSGVFWIATRSGIYKLSPETNRFQNFTIKSRNTELSYNPNITCFYKHDNNLWIGSESQNIWYDHKTNKISFRKILKNKKDTSAVNFFRGSNGQVYVNTSGIFYFDPGTGTTKEIESKGDPVALDFFKQGRFHRILTDTIDGSEVWWLAGWRDPSWGLYLFNTKTRIVRRFEFFDNGNPLQPVSFRGVQKDKYGKIWVGTEGSGLIRLNNYQTGDFTLYKNSPGDSSSLPSSFIVDICKDASNNIWIITGSAGIAKIIFDKNQCPVFKPYSSDAGLRHLALYDGLTDNNNNIWLSSSAGLEKFNTITQTFSHYGFEYGIFNPQLATGCYKDDDGNFYFSSWFTFIRFNPDSLINSPSIPGIDISRLYLMNHDSSELLLSENPKIPFSKNTVSFSLETIDHLNPNGIKYKYKLEGLEKDWVESGSRNYVSYTDLAPGFYTFRFTAAKNENVWNGIPVSFAFTILTPWYRSWWFISLIILAVIGSVFILFRFRLNQKLKLFTVRQRLHRDLHDDVGATLSSVKAYSEILKDNPNNPVIAELIKDNSTEMIERLEVIAWATNPVHDNFLSLKNKMLKFALPICHANKVHCTIESTGINDELQVPGEIRQNVFLIFKEAVNNCLKYAEASAISTSMFIQQKKFIVQVTDNGKGSDGKVKGSGNGWMNMQKRVEELNGLLKIESLPQKGTTISASFPYPFKIPNSWDRK